MNMKLIDKDAMLAEIERLRALLPDANDCDYSQLEFARGQQDILTDFEEFIRTLEVKEVDFVDLDKEITSYIHDNTCNGYFRADIHDVAKYFFELGLKAMEE